MISKIKTANHDEWLALRKQYIGGSDAAAVVGMNPWVSPYALWAEKSGIVPSFEGNLITEVGSYLEEFVAQKFEEATGKKVRRCNLSMINDKYPFAIANVDRLIVGERAGLEIKTTSSLLTKKFKGGEFPEQYYCQCTHYLAVTGLERWYLAVLIGNRELKIFCIERDEEEISALMEAERVFFDRIKNNQPPAVDGMEATSKALGDVFAQTNEEKVSLTQHEGVVEEYMRLSAEIDKLKIRKDELANGIKSVLGNSTEGESVMFKVSWRPQERSSVDIKALQRDFPQINLNKYTKKSVSRVFRVNRLSE